MEETIPMYNSITIIGNLGRDPEIRETQKGSQFATLSVATNRMVQGERETDWHKVVVWDTKITEVLQKYTHKGSKVLLRGRLTYKKWTNKEAQKLAKKKHVIMISGRYEGVDARVKKILRAKEYSIGDYVTTGGELPAMVLIDTISRQIEGVLGKKESLEETRTASPEVYTRPEVIKWKGKNYKVPKVLLSGNHKEIEAWRKKQLQKRKGA